MLEVSKLDLEFKYEISRHPGGKNIMRCYACGTCTAGCPIREIDERYNPRKIIRMALLGMREDVLKSDFVWLCSTCYTCHERCPQDVKITDVMTVLKNMAVKEGYIHPAFKAQAELIGTFGRLYEVADFDNKKRDKIGLPSVKKTFDDVKEIYKITGLDKLILK